MIRSLFMSIIALTVSQSSFATTYLAKGLYDNLDELKEKSVQGIIDHYKARGINATRENIFSVGLSGFETGKNERVEKILLHSGCDIVAEEQGGVADWCNISFALTSVTNQSGQKVEQFRLEKVDCFQYD